MHQLTAKIVANEKAGSYMLMKLTAPELARAVQPGQFLMLQVPHPPDPLLRRPFSIYDTWPEDSTREPDGVTLLYRVVGRGTQIMSQLPAGADVGLVGPLGKGFSQCKTARALLVAGGTGIASLRLLARRLKSAGCKVILLAGARTAAQLHVGDFIEADQTTVATDDGSQGIKGPVSIALEAALEDESEETFIYASGPKAMLQRVAHLTELYGVGCELSLESRMACGVGACCGCVVKALTPDGEPAYLRVCKDGPVFDYRRIVEF